MYLPEENRFAPFCRRLAVVLLVCTGGSLARAATDDMPRFDVWEYQVHGNTVLNAPQIERAVYPHLGPGRTLADVQAAKSALETLYREAGYGAVVVNIPEQDVDAGIVRLDVMEGRVDRLMVSGSRYFSPDRIKQKVPSLDKGEVPYLPQVQKELLALNRVTPDRAITPVLRPGRDPGTVEADLKVADKLPVHGALEVNDRYSRDTPRTRVNASLSYGNLWQREHAVTLGYQAAPDDTNAVEVFYGTYLMRLDRWLVSAYYVDSQSDVTTVGTTGVLGQGKLGGLRFIRPLGAIGSGFQTLTFGADYKDFAETTGLEGSPDEIETPIDYFVALAGYDLSFTDDEQSTKLSLEITAAPRISTNNQKDFYLLISNDPLVWEGKRYKSKNNFMYTNLGFSHLRRLWLDTEFRLHLRGQLADSPLISNEQFGIGGVDSVRGYLESEVFVDDGAYGQLELYSPEIGKRIWNELSTRLLVFTDAGGGRVQDPLPEQNDEFFIWSAGAGIRLALWDKLTAALDWAHAFEGAKDGVVEKGDDRLHFDVRLAF